MGRMALGALAALAQVQHPPAIVARWKAVLP